MDLGHRPRRLRATGSGQAADDDGHARGGDRRHPGDSSRDGRSTYEGTELTLPWTGRWTLPVWVAGYGPMALAMAGRIADGIILQLADPDLIRWFVGQVCGTRRQKPAAMRRRSRSRPRRRPTSGRAARAASVPLVPGAGLEPRRGPRQQVPARAAARVADRLHPAIAPDTTTCTTPRSARATRPSWATR